MEMILNTVRIIDNDQAREYAFGDTKSLEHNLAIGFINPTDFKRLNLTQSLHLKISNNNGQIIIRIKEDENIHKGSLLMPVSIWSNQLVSVENNNLIYKNIEVNVEATREPITSFSEILNSIKKKI